MQKSENHKDEEISCSSLRSCKLLLKMLNYLQDEFNNRSTGVCTDEEKMNDIVDMIKIEHLDENRNIAFLSEHLSLLKPQWTTLFAISYCNDLYVAICVPWFI